MLENLADLFRAVMADSRALVPFSQELASGQGVCCHRRNSLWAAAARQLALRHGAGQCLGAAIVVAAFGGKRGFARGRAA